MDSINVLEYITNDLYLTGHFESNMAVDNLRKIALAVVKNDDGEVLIVKRKNPDQISSVGDLSWAFPGGLISPDEDPHEVAIQETLEETGHYIEALSLISERKYPKNSVHLHYFECKLTTSATTQLIDEHEIEQFAWVKAKRLKDHFGTDIDRTVAKFLGL